MWCWVRYTYLFLPSFLHLYSRNLCAVSMHLTLLWYLIFVGTRSEAGIVHSVKWLAAHWKQGFNSFQRQEFFSFAIVSRPALKPAQPLI